MDSDAGNLSAVILLLLMNYHFVQVFKSFNVNVLVCLVLQVHVLCVFVYAGVQVGLGSRVRRCCRALLTAAGNQSTLSVYFTTRRFLNDLS